ncbi:hypothetical protein LINPERPRIM_LOCUS1231 [Linum perenne]
MLVYRLESLFYHLMSLVTCCLSILKILYRIHLLIVG